MHTKRLRKATGVIRSMCNDTIVHNMLSIVTNQIVCDFTACLCTSVPYKETTEQCLCIYISL